MLSLRHAHTTALILLGALSVAASCRSANEKNVLADFRVVSTQAEVVAREIADKLYLTRFELLIELLPSEKMNGRKLCVRTFKRGPERLLVGPNIELLDKTGKVIPQSDEGFILPMKYELVPTRNLYTNKEYNYDFEYGSSKPEDARFYRTMWTFFDCRTRRPIPYSSDWMPITIRSEKAH